MLMMEHVCVVCAIKCVIAMFLKPKLLKLEFMIIITKALPFGTQCFLVPFLDSLVLVGTQIVRNISNCNIWISIFYFTSIRYDKLRGWRNYPLHNL